MIVWDRVPIGPAESLPELKAHLERDFFSLETAVARLGSLVDLLTAARIIGGISVPMLWDDTTTAGDPGPRYMRGNAVNMNAVTELYLSKTDAAGRTIDYDTSGGQELVIQSVNATHYLIGRVALVQDNGDWMTWTIENYGGAGNPSQDDVFTIRWYPAAGDF